VSANQVQPNGDTVCRTVIGLIRAYFDDLIRKDVYKGKWHLSTLDGVLDF
jgi:hypothetical protein